MSKKSQYSDQIEDLNQAYGEAQSRMELLPAYYDWTYGIFRKFIRGSVIELGCGAGLGIRTYADRATQVFAIDYNDELLRRVRMSFKGASVETIQADLLGEWDELRSVCGDTVLIMDVLEHFEDDLRFLRRAVSLLKSGGQIIIKVPAQSGLYSPSDEASGHFRRYDPCDIRRLARAADLHVDMLRYINCVGALAYRLKKGRRSNFSKTFSPIQLRLINFALPLARAIDLVPGLSGLSLAVVLSKRDG